MLWLAFLLSDHIFFQNEDDLKLVRSKGLLWKREYTIVHGSGVNLEHFSLADLPDEPVFLMVSRLTASKGVNEYVRAALEVREKYPEARFYLVGPMDDDDRSLDQGMIQKAAREGTVILTGWVDDVRPFFIEKSRVL
jgi:glycosyltransferase involved in cell wall biosynthesis